jgi:hypothetical protein
MIRRVVEIMLSMIRECCTLLDPIWIGTKANAVRRIYLNGLTTHLSYYVKYAKYAN